MGTRRVVPWEPERVFDVRAAMVGRFRPMVDVGAGYGLRQGEILGLSVDDIDFDSGTLHVVQQLKLSLSKAVLAPPKGGKLPWMRANGQPVTRRLSVGLSSHKITWAEVPERFQGAKMPPAHAVCAGGGHDHQTYFFLPWFFTASIAAAAASGSR